MNFVSNFSKLVQRSIEVAKEKGCDYYYVCCSGLYSQRIFEKLNFETIHELKYAEWIDRHGNVVIKNHGEHPSAKLMIQKLN